jgi:hypothetical protein
MVNSISALSSDSADSAFEWSTALAYAKAHGLPTDSPYVRKLGRLASAFCRATGISPGKVAHPLYVTVGSYPDTVLAAAAFLIKLQG